MAVFLELVLFPSKLLAVKHEPMTFTLDPCGVGVCAAAPGGRMNSWSTPKGPW